MMNPTDCDVRFATHARQIARVNDHEWMRPQRATVAQETIFTRLGSLLITLGARLAHQPTHARKDPARVGS